MRVLSFIFVSLFAAGSARAQGPDVVYTPTHKDLDVTTYVNAEIVRVDTASNTLTFRSESGDTVLTVAGRAVDHLGRLRRGDEVILGYRFDPRGVRVVTAILAGETAESRLQAASDAPETRVVRVIRTDRAARTLTFTDEQGATGVVAVSGAAALRSLGTVLPGDQVNVTFVPGAAPMAGTVGTVGTIALGGEPTFVTGQLLGLDPARGTVTMQTPFGNQVFPVRGGDLSGLGAFRPGESLRLNLGGTGAERSVTGFTQVAGASGTGFRGTVVPTAVSGGFAAPQAFIGPPVAAGGAGTIPGGVPNRMISAPSVPGGQFTPPLGSLSNANTPLPGTPGTSGMAAGTVSFPGAGGVSTMNAPASAFASVIPSLPSTVGTLNVVPPPAMAPSAVETPVGAARPLAARDYDAAVNALAMKANEIDMHWFRYRDNCLRVSALTPEIDQAQFAPGRDRQWFLLLDGDVRTPTDDNCRQLMIEMTRMATDWRDMMLRAEDTARAHDVLPGTMREVRQRYRVEF